MIQYIFQMEEVFLLEITWTIQIVKRFLLQMIPFQFLVEIQYILKILIRQMKFKT